MALSGLDAQAAKIVDPSTDINVKLGIIRDLSRTLAPDAQRDPEWQRATSTVFPILIDTLKTGHPVWKRLIHDKENVEQILRIQTLELLHKFTTNEVIKQHLQSLVPLLLDLIRNDNEDMGLLALKMFGELLRAFRALVEPHVSKYFQLLQELYSSTVAYVEELFSPTGAAMVEPDRSTFAKAFPSLKLLSEASLQCLFIYQFANNIPSLQALLPPCQVMLDPIVKFYTMETQQEKEKDADQMDEGEIQFGAPASVVNKGVFLDFIAAQTRVGPLIAFFLKKDPPDETSETWTNLCNTVPAAAVRMLRLMSPEAYGLRKEGIMALRHIAGTNMRNKLCDFIPNLIDERFIVGNLRSEPVLFTVTHASMADIIHSVRPLLDLPALMAILKSCSELLADNTIPPNLLAVESKIFVTCLESFHARLQSEGASISPEMSKRASIFLHALLETLSSRMNATVQITQKLNSLRDGNASDDLKALVSFEQTRIIPTLSHLVVESHEGALGDEKFCARAFLIALRSILLCIRFLNTRVPDGDIMGRLFRSVCLVLPILRGDNSEMALHKHLVDTFVAMEPHVFQEVWTTNMDFFFKLLIDSPNLVVILQYLYQQQATAFSLTALVMRYMVDNLETLLEGNSTTLAIIIRTLRMTFASVANMDDGLEKILFPHLTTLLVDVFPMAARSQDPRNFLSVPYYLFRSLGSRSQTAKFEQLHKEVYPLLPELLDGVNRALELTDDPVHREQLVEIALTTPARVQHLSPYITQLWRPLVLALGSRSPELLRQGLRTLELAVENLPNVDLLDPSAEPLAKELVLALHRTLKPGAGSAETAQAASRILGKIGGRNRRILSLPPTLSYEPSTTPASIPIQFTSHTTSLQTYPACEVAVNVLQDAKSSVYHESAFNLLRAQVLYNLQKGVDDPAAEDIFVKALEGLVSCIHLSNMEPAANELLRDVAKALFEMELAKDVSVLPGRRLMISPVTSMFLESVASVLVNRVNGNHTNARRLMANIIQELHDRGQNDSKDRSRNTATLVVQVIAKFVSLCWNADWRRKVAGCEGIALMISDEINLGTQWPFPKEIELCRSIIMVLKDMPPDPPVEVPEVKAILLRLIRFCNSPRTGNDMAVDMEPLDEAAKKEMTSDEINHYEWMIKPPAKKCEIYLNLFYMDLTSSNKTVRETCQACLELMSQLADMKLSDFVKPMVDKLVSNIFTKPLRMFLPLIQIGYMEAMTYLLSMDPPVVEVSDELWRLLNEVIGLGEAEDPPPHPMSPLQRLPRRIALLSAKTKAASIRLITASLVVADYFSKQPVIRQRATTLLFKALYSNNTEIKTAAHDGLKIFLKNQSRLPREHLQAGLRPVLMNLADPAKLTVASLDGLARLLGLLTNYFKVEIATKLMDHFKALSDDSTLEAAAYGPMADNETICKLVRLLNIFHLLPPAANVYLEPVMTLVVQVETKIHAASPTVFTPPVAAYLDRFPSDGANILLKYIKESRWVQTFRHVIQSKAAPNFAAELKARGADLAQAMENVEHAHAGVPSILLCLDLAENDPEWMAKQEDILEGLKAVWASQFTETVDTTSYTSARLVLIRAIYTIWMKVFTVSPRVDILYALALIFTRPAELSYYEVIEFISTHVANNTSSSLRNQAIQYFITLLDEGSMTDSHILQYLRVVVLPLLAAEFKQTTSTEKTVDSALIQKLLDKVWSQEAAMDYPPLFTIELTQLTGMLLANAYTQMGVGTIMSNVARYLYKLLRTPEPMIRNSACLAAARYFLKNLISFEKDAKDTKESKQVKDEAIRFWNFVWIGLLKAPHDGETSPVTRLALDIMMTHHPVGEASTRWDTIIYRTLGDEQNNISTTVHIYRLILRHADQCYQSRELFIPQIVQGLNRLGFNAGTTPETRILALDLVDLVMGWQRRASEERNSAMAVDQSPAQTKWVMSSQQKDNLANYLIRYSLNTGETAKTPGITARHLVQLKTLFCSEDWSDVTIRLSFFARAFENPETSDNAMMSLMNNVKVLNVIAAEKPKAWYMANAAELFMFSKKAMVAPSDGVVEAFAPVYERLLDTLSLGDEGVELTGLASDVYQWLSDTIRDSLATGVAASGTLANLTALVKASPSRIDQFANGLMKVFNRLVKDHIAPAATQAPNPQPQVPGQVLTPAQVAAQNQSRAAEPSLQIVQKIFSVLEICRLSVSHFGENRKQFLSGLVLLVSSSQNADIRRRILSLTKEWVLGRPIVNPTPKEKASLMQKMQIWQKFNDTIYRDYLNLVFDVYSTPSMARTDLTVRLETSFVLGCRLDDMALRTRFLDLFSEHVPKAIGSRLAYLIGGQSWESMGEFNWAYVVLDMIFGAANGEAILTPAINALSTLSTTELRVKDMLQPMRHLLFYSSLAMHQTFVTTFPQVWQGLNRKEQADITASLVHVLTKDWRHDLPRPNVMQSLLGGVQSCVPSIALPPHVLKYLVKIYHAWYEGLEILQHAVEQGREDDDTIRDSNQDALAELYSELCEDDYFYGLWRRRSLYEETNAALSYEQNGFYNFAQPLYEIAQMKARQNIYPMSETEYYIWEDHWMLCTEKLLQWDILQDVASGEGNPDLALECAWRTLQTWNSENVVVATYMNQAQDPVTPRRLLFKAYFTLNTMACAAREQLQAAAQAASQGAPGGLQPQVKLDIDASSEFSKVVDEANQITLRKWFMLPENLTMAHVPLLAQFQQVVELKEASLLMTTLLATTRENLNEKAHEAKSIFHHWRERLPQPHDDIGLWNDLVSWRQHVFHAVNKFYLPLLTEAPAQSTASTHAHRGHHESAWIINRFAHVARKHGLLQVCQNSLADIYKLPNIEISEAFLKLREQARCHYEKPNELYQGLEVINNTNLMYFTAPQKAEFYAMKGLFLHKMNRQEDANAAFGQAVQLDFSMPKAWALWGVYSDDMHTANPTDFSLAANAVSCYLQAASLYKSAKSRPLLNRILWLLSMDDQQQTVGRMWDTYKGEHVYWYWITFIPQLLMSLSQREGRFAHQVLYNIAKMFPQALYYPLRSLRDEFMNQKKEHLQRLQASAQTAAQSSVADVTMSDAGATAQLGADGSQPQAPTTADVNMPLMNQKYPWDMADELIALLKTGHPLLALTMEQLAEQIRDRLKPHPDEEVYRVTTSLLSDVLQQSYAGQSRVPTMVSAQLLLNAQKVGGSLPPGRVKEEFETQLANGGANVGHFIKAVIYLRDHYEVMLDRKLKVHSMDVWSHYLVEFHLSKFEKISVPGQYLEHHDNHAHFVEIKRLSTRLERCRGPMMAFRRITFIGHDASKHTFTVQYYQNRAVRRDERLMQLVRVFNETLRQKKEARKRNLEFHLLPSVALSPYLRLVKLDGSYVSLVDIHDEYCKRRGFGREEPIILFQERVRAYNNSKQEEAKEKEVEISRNEFLQVRLDAKNEVEAKYIPKTVISNYMKQIMKDSYSLWTMRKQFTLQTAANSFLHWSLFLGTRPQKVLISRETGLISSVESSPPLRGDKPFLGGSDITPFRLTPNIQDFITPIGVEGLLTSSLLAISRGLLEPECDVQKQMWLLIRDDFMLWFKTQARDPASNERLEFRVCVAESIERIIKRMSQLSASNERAKAQAAEGTSSLPTTTVVAPIQQLINTATNPAIQSRNHDLYYPWF